MSKYQSIDEIEYKEAISKAWKVKLETKERFPKQIADWINHHTTIVGVPESYLSIPLLVSAAYCSQHATINAGDLSK